MLVGVAADADAVGAGGCSGVAVGIVRVLYQRNRGNEFVRSVEWPLGHWEQLCIMHSEYGSVLSALVD